LGTAKTEPSLIVPWLAVFLAIKIELDDLSPVIYHIDMLNTKSLVDQIYDALLLRIRTLQYKPGSRINLDQLKVELGVSTAPIREALQRLARDNIVVIKPRVGYNVASLSQEDVAQVFETRLLLELYGLKGAIKTNDKDTLISVRDEFRNLGDRLLKEVPPSEGLVTECTELDDLLHKHIIVGNSKNKFIVNFYETMDNFSSIIRHFSFRLSLDVKQHIAILDAMISGDLALAEKELSFHLQDARDSTLEWLAHGAKKEMI